ncbi:phage integrase SAM-like domain-containing protein [uncultured Arthrobacter sp.]|uniref:phage integrase SAM-like domain-containing protein n=1 Tax=uncultured Arthrobacter sp. TaxID=114050 RepID=UPI002614D92D|nr:phage integrase SAM-like domain-containing protein [uncultured Arthrobacter sp.]
MGDAELYGIFETNPQPVGNLVTVAQAEEMEAFGHPWPVSGDLSVLQPIRRPLRQLTATGAARGVPRSQLTIGRWMLLWLDLVDEQAATEGEIYTGTDRHILRETAAGRARMFLLGRRQQVTEYLIPQLPELLLFDLNESDVEELAASLLAMKGKRGKPLSKSTVQSVLTHLKRALSAAQREELIDSNPAQGFARYLGLKDQSRERWMKYREQLSA